MQELAGKTAFVTGGASGIGLALGRAFAEAGMQVMLADIETEAMGAAVKSLHNFGPDVRGVVCDVTDPDSVERAAAASFEAFGNVHVVCNNAGVAGGSGIDDILLDDWRWVLDVNLMGVLHGIRTFLPHIHNTASMAGMVSGLGFSPYSASKFAVVTMSEGLALHLTPLGIGVTVLCPGWVRTRINESARNRSERYGAARAPEPGSWGSEIAAHVAERIQSGLDPSEVAARVLAAIRDDELYVFTHPEMRVAPPSSRPWTKRAGNRPTEFALSHARFADGRKEILIGEWRRRCALVRPSRPCYDHAGMITKRRPPVAVRDRVNGAERRDGRAAAGQAEEQQGQRRARPPCRGALLRRHRRCAACRGHEGAR
jgi:NAD(P)-dependent dehydrogenase (short-subunit alcohol dehydrogenase family)